MKIKIQKNKSGYNIEVNHNIVHSDRNIDFIKGWLSNQLNNEVESIIINS